MEILHISDTHGHGETHFRIEKLALDLSDCDVVALTGDCTSLLTTKVPGDWNDWPHRLKLLVPGNHDGQGAFDALSSWCHRLPWTSCLDGLAFVGLDTVVDCDSVEEQLARAVLDLPSTCSALVILMHRWPRDMGADRIGGPALDQLNGRPVLVLHGHDHPSWFSGSLWERDARLGELRCHRSQVYSAVAGKRGMAHLISFDEGAFSCVPIRARP